MRGFGAADCQCITSPCNCAAILNQKVTPEEEAAWRASNVQTSPTLATLADPSRFANAMSGMKYLAFAAACFFVLLIWWGRE